MIPSEDDNYKGWQIAIKDYQKIHKDHIMNSVQIAVAEQITNLSPQVEDEVVSVLVKRELEKRSGALVKVIDDLSKLEGELKKIKPDQVSYDAEGKVASETYSKAKTEEAKKLRDKIGKYTGAINKALEKAEFKDVYDLKNNAGNQSKGGSGSEEEIDIPIY